MEIVGQIKNNSGTYSLTIPPGQMALEGSTIQNNLYLYVRNSRNTAITHTLSGKNWNMSNRIMISPLNSNSNNFTSTSNFNLTWVSDLTGSTSTGITPTDDYSQLYLKYTGKMFTADLPAGLQGAPAQRTEGGSSSVATIEAAYGLLNINKIARAHV